MAMILDRQPGRSQFLPQVAGQIDAAENNTVTDWLSQLVWRDHLPQKSSSCISSRTA
jgi:hypothetical protein